MKKIAMKKPNKRLGILIAIVSFAVVATIVTLISKAATPTASIEVGSASTVTAPAAVVTDATASGGNAVQFKPAPVTPPPTGGSRCPAYPSFPDASCTGVKPGSTLTNCSATVTQADAVYENCLFSNGVIYANDIMKSPRTLTIRNSKIVGALYPTVTPQAGEPKVTLEDVEVDGNKLQRSFGGAYTCTRCNIYNVARGFEWDGYTLIDSYIHGIYGFADSHNEAVLAAGSGITISHTTLESNWSSSTTGGGMSAALAIYNHNGPTARDILVEKSKITTSVSYYCMYGGNSGRSGTIAPANIRIIDNVFGPCTPQGGQNGLVVGWLRGNGNVWTGNKWADGTAIPEPTSGQYN